MLDVEAICRGRQGPEGPASAEREILSLFYLSLERLERERDAERRAKSSCVVVYLYPCQCGPLRGVNICLSD